MQRERETGKSEELLQTLYAELRRLAAAKLARERPGHTLQATALVHEAYLRLTDGDGDVTWESEKHFFGAAAEAMRRILIDRARQKATRKAGGDRQRVELRESRFFAGDGDEEETMALDEALTRFEAVDADAALLVKLRYFAGLSQEEAARALEIPLRTANRRWAYARAWLYRELSR